jgi:hypothetical protein
MFAVQTTVVSYTTMRGLSLIAFSLILCSPIVAQDRYQAADGKLRVALAQQPLGPNGPSKGPDTMATGGIQKILADLGALVRVERAQLTPLEDAEYGGWKKLGMSLGHFADIVSRCLDWSRDCSDPGRPSNPFALACCGSTPIPISTLQKRRVAVRSAVCQSPSRPAAHCT